MIAVFLRSSSPSSTPASSQRKCPMVLNDATQAQPKIDRTNKKRQFQLAIERRLPTHNFPFRLFSTVFGTSIADTYYMHIYHNKDPKLEWYDAVRRMCMALMYNNIDAIEAGDCPANELFTIRSPHSDETTAGAPEGGKDGVPPFLRSHFLVPFKCVPGYKGSKQQRCVINPKKATTMVCISCTKSAKLILPLHPSSLAQHQREPSKHECVLVGKKKRAERRSEEPEGGPTEAGPRRRSRCATAQSNSSDSEPDNSDSDSDSDSDDSSDDQDHSE